MSSMNHLVFLFAMQLSAATIDVTAMRPNDAPWPTSGDHAVEFQVLSQSTISLTMSINGYQYGFCSAVDPQQSWLCSGSVNQGASIKDDGGATIASIQMSGYWARGSVNSNGVDPSGYCPFGSMGRFYQSCVTTLQPGAYWLYVWAWGNASGDANTTTKQFLWETDGHILGDVALTNPGKRVSVAAVPEPSGFVVIVGLLLAVLIRKLKGL